jgi:DNA-nicking Smr family endonuclease
MTAPKTMSAEDQAEFNSLLADYKKMVPDQAAFDALPPDVQEKLIAIANRVQNMEQQGNK